MTRKTRPMTSTQHFKRKRYGYQPNHVKLQQKLNHNYAAELQENSFDAEFKRLNMGRLTVAEVEGRSSVQGSSMLKLGDTTATGPEMSNSIQVPDGGKLLGHYGNKWGYGSRKNTSALAHSQNTFQNQLKNASTHTTTKPTDTVQDPPELTNSGLNSME